MPGREEEMVKEEASKMRLLMEVLSLIMSCFLRFEAMLSPVWGRGVLWSESGTGALEAHDV